MNIGDLLRDPKETRRLMREALAHGRTLGRHLKAISRNGSASTAYKPAPAGRAALHERKLQIRQADGQGEARHVTPPPATMVEAYERRPGGMAR